MYEQVLESLIERYRSQGLSVDRVLLDPAYRSMPMPEKIKVIVKYGNAIKAGQKVDSTFWKDLGLGLAGTAYMGYPVIMAAKRIGWAGFNKGKYAAMLPEELEAEKERKGKLEPTEPEAGDADLLIRTAITGAFTTSSFKKAHKAYKIRQVVKKFLSDKEPITQAQAIEVVSRTL